MLASPPPSPSATPDHPPLAGQRGAALKVLFQGSIENEQNPSVIAAAGGIPVLSAVLADGSDYTSEHKVDAVGTLFNVTSFANDGSEPVATEAVVEHIVSLLRSATVDEEGKAWAAGTLQNLAGGHPEHRVVIGGTPNAVATLLDQARSPTTNTDTRRIVVAAVYNLTIDRYVLVLDFLVLSCVCSGRPPAESACVAGCTFSREPCSQCNQPRDHLVQRRRGYAGVAAEMRRQDPGRAC